MIRATLPHLPMAIRVALTHQTRYRYDREVALGPHVIRLRPAPHCRTPILAYSLRVTPREHFLNWQQDPFSNYQARVVFPKPARELVVEVDLIAEMVVVNPFDFFVDEYAERYPFAYEPSLARELTPYLERAPPGAHLATLVEEARARHARGNPRNVDLLVALNSDLQQRLRYDIRLEPGVFAPEETLARGHGSCRDFAWLAVQLLRHLGFAARFVSGYSIQLAADVRPLEGAAGVSVDAADLHAWAEVYLPGAGWIGLDATSGLLAGEGHIPLACTADPATAAPITGAFTFRQEHENDRVTEELAFTTKVERIAEQPRVTRPYREDEWEAIEGLGQAIDADLARQDVRLTMGGEPTFVSIDEPAALEWNTAALGSSKRELADRLARRLRTRFAPGGILHHGQGKWYPGEPLPRWAYSIYFRRDGEPLWREQALLAEEPPERAAVAEDAAAFLTLLARRLGVAGEHVLPAYEDVFYYLWRERRLPANVDPLENRLDDPLERARLARLFGGGLGRVVGHALPLRPDEAAPQRWQTARWHLRAEHLYLVPGDSPMGFRLPLDGLPWEDPAERAALHERDPLAARPPLPAAAGLDQSGPGAIAAAPAAAAAKTPVVRTALCAEPRDGILHLFLPPVSLLEEYVALVGAIEDVARERGQPVRLEGYHPPADPRLGKLQVTPDPGVIEVNTHPSASWSELVASTTTLYEEARQCRLGTEKFMVDGRHTGTGGGNHVVLGGPSAADSPFLRRPDLLRSLVGYWIDHPSLSNLFSGLFVGPTSQAPRVDEARHDSLHELEVAFAELDAQLQSRAVPPPWLVDRLFRNLLVDVTGNTHRTEICIDKLYSPDAASGRQGLVELRAFEMPPHARMSLTQQLLLRGLVAWMWRTPYRPRLPRRGTGLVDRFTLPHFVAQDFGDVLGDLRAAGYSFAPDWFRAHQEFRFPLYGAIDAAGLRLELRQAIEPWHVLGEEPGGGGTARYVDSSVERVEVKVRGMLGDRHVVACGGRRVPLHPTGTPGELVAGVRFRAWQPAAALHPTIGVHTPLVFDVIDSWTGRAVGGCQYHVAHPGGRAYETPPANGVEAESRRAARFFPFGHTPGPIATPPEERNPDFPLTLDLRRPPPWAERVV
jgi:uncharacterized protein (DUF2126 family)/transglutaminase-like putative cysteine protease